MRAATCSLVSPIARGYHHRNPRNQEGIQGIIRKESKNSSNRSFLGFLAFLGFLWLAHRVALAALMVPQLALFLFLTRFELAPFIALILTEVAQRASAAARQLARLLLMGLQSPVFLFEPAFETFPLGLLTLVEPLFLLLESLVLIRRALRLVNRLRF